MNDIKIAFFYNQFLLFFLKGLTCYCDGSCPGNTQNGTCEVRAGGQCFSAVEEVSDEITGLIEPEYSFGCLSPDQAGGLLQVYNLNINNSKNLKLFFLF